MSQSTPALPPSVQPPDQASAAPPPYANSSYSLLTPTDITILFMRIPTVTKEQIEAMKEKSVPFQGTVVSSVTIPLKHAVELGNALIKLVEQAPK